MRASEINALAPTAQFFHVPGKKITADLLTRGVSVSTLMKRDDWLNGPDWLSSQVPSVAVYAQLPLSKT